MSRFVAFCYTVIIGVCVLLAFVGLSSCATERFAPAVDARVDSALTAAGVPPLSVRRVKFNGPVTFQIGGTGNSATQLGKAKAPLATAPHATATAPVTKAGVPWQVYAGGAVLLLGLGFYARGRLKLPLPF